MRVAGPLLTLSALLVAAPALAQGGGYYDSGSPYNQDRFGRYNNYPQPQAQTWQGPMHYGQSGQWQNYPQQSGSQWQQSNPMQQGPYGGYPQTGPSQMGQMGQRGQSTSGPVSFATQGQIKNSLESSGFKNVTVLPESFLIRATAPDGSRVLMQVSSDSLTGIVVNPDQGGSSGSASSSSTGNTSSTTGTASNTGGTSSTGTASNTGGTSSGGTGGTSSSGSSTGTNSTGSTSGGTDRSTSR